jgi:hypothetical protein
MYFGDRAAHTIPEMAGPNIAPMSSKEPSIPIDNPMCSLGESSEIIAVSKGLTERQTESIIESRYMCMADLAKKKAKKNRAARRKPAKVRVSLLNFSDNFPTSTEATRDIRFVKEMRKPISSVDILMMIEAYSGRNVQMIIRAMKVIPETIINSLTDGLERRFENPAFIASKILILVFFSCFPYLLIDITVAATPMTERIDDT